jgi:ribonuclease BN (tRNA processing enzyme)
MSSSSTPPIRRGSSARSRSRPGRSTTVLWAARSSRCASGIDGRTIAYTGDTAWTDTLIDVADGTDLLIAEAYFWDKPVPYHLRHADLVEHRTQITRARTILTHMSTDMLAHAGAAEFELAHDGLTINL